MSVPFQAFLPPAALYQPGGWFNQNANLIMLFCYLKSCNGMVDQSPTPVLWLLPSPPASSLQQP